MTQAPVVHIGHYKTATTWFQRVFYPEVAGGAFAGRRATREAFLSPTAFKFDPEAARRALALPPDRRPLVCDEALCGHYESSGLLEALSKDVAYRLRAVFPDAHIVVLLREQLDMLTATYLQYLRRGGTATPDAFIRPYAQSGRDPTKAFKAPLFSLDHFEYHHLLRHYRQVFGAGRVHVHLYEDFKADPLAFLRRLAGDLGLRVPLDRLDLRPANVSYRARVYPLARLMNHVTQGDAVNRRCLAPLLPRKWCASLMARLNRTALAGPRVTPERLFGPETVEELRRRFAESNRVLRDEWGLDVAAHGYPVAEGTPGPAKVGLAEPRVADGAS